MLDNLFGPQWGSAFDFTLTFENWIFTLLPAALIIAATPIYTAACLKRPVACFVNGIFWTKLVGIKSCWNFLFIHTQILTLSQKDCWRSARVCKCSLSRALGQYFRLPQAVCCRRRILVMCRRALHHCADPVEPSLLRSFFISIEHFLKHNLFAWYCKESKFLSSWLWLQSYWQSFCFRHHCPCSSCCIGGNPQANSFRIIQKQVGKCKRRQSDPRVLCNLWRFDRRVLESYVNVLDISYPQDRFQQCP